MSLSILRHIKRHWQSPKQLKIGENHECSDCFKLKYMPQMMKQIHTKLHKIWQITITHAQSWAKVLIISSVVAVITHVH